MNKAGLTDSLKELGFNTVGYGCTTCIGNSGPLPEPVAEAIKSGDLVASAVLSGNRNFEGRVNPLTKANYLGQPAAGRRLRAGRHHRHRSGTEPIGQDDQGNDVFLKEIWPTAEEVRQTIASSIEPEMFTSTNTKRPSKATSCGTRIDAAGGAIYPWSDQ